MSAHTFQPGEVAMVTERLDHRGAQDAWIAAKDDKGWASLDPRIGWISDSDVLTARPLVVIDPEDREQVERLIHTYFGAWAARKGYGHPSYQKVDIAGDDLQAALREFADPKPPKPSVLAHITSAPVNGIVQALCGKTFQPHGPDEVVVEGNCTFCATRATGWVS